MSFLRCSKITEKTGLALLAAVLLCGWTGAAQAAVETYLEQAVPSPPPPNVPAFNRPLKAGQMTLEDVLTAHPPKKAAPPPASVLTPPAVAPSLAAAPKSSATNLMMMQGMKLVLQKSGEEVGTPLKPPQLPGAAGMAAASAPASDAVPPRPVSVPEPGVQYEPGREPKDLSGGMPLDGAAAPVSQIASQPSAAPSSSGTFIGGVEVPRASSSAPASTSSSPAPTISAPVAPAVPDADGCTPRSESWVKNCTEAGYPASFTGQIRGETRIACPGSSLQDVWVSNSCAPPEGDAGAAPLTAPSSSATSFAAPSETAPAYQAPALSQGDGACGSANGLAMASAPYGDLCASGEASSVSGDGPWRWNCRGLNGGMIVSCAAPALPSATPAPAIATTTTAPSPSAPMAEDGVCGAASGGATGQAPTSGLCARGIPSRVSGEGPWNWACSGKNGGHAAACSATAKIDGACGAANNTDASDMPMSDLCAAGYASAVTGSGPWNWTCSGLHGGAAATCSAAPRQDAVCGPASGVSHREAPIKDLCSVGRASSVTGGGPWNWACSGANGGAAVSCTAPISINGACGSANGVPVAEAPGENLCASGAASRVTGVGPWSWNCAGTGGGDSQSCTAPLGSAPASAEASDSTPVPAPALQESATSEETAAPAPPAHRAAKAHHPACGAASERIAFGAPEKDLCSKGKPGAVRGDGPWHWSCDVEGHDIPCSTLSPSSQGVGSLSSGSSKTTEAPAPKAAPAAAVTVAEEKAACGTVSGTGTSEAPSESLCASGKASAVRGSGPWQWNCTKGKHKASCEAPKFTDAACGATNGSVQRSAPATGLCNSGTATGVQGTGPWMWSCVGSGGGVSVSCSAASQAQTRVDGSCGAAASATTISAPAANLCDSGVASNVYGQGPWTWTCGGLNGGAATSCSAQKDVPPAPPPPGPSVNGLCGNANGVAALVQPMDDLCTGGTATAVSGQGPWNWNCLGENGGMSVSCTAPLQPPAPITGVCGSASGVPTLTTPRSALCSAGIASAVNGRGPWTWSCSGTNGGGAVACVAPLAGGTSGGPLPSLVSTPAEAPAPQAAPTPSVSGGALTTPRLPTGPLPPLETGTMPQLKPSKPFAAPPEPSALPPVPAPGESPMAPATAADLPAGTTPLAAPMLRDTAETSSGLKATGGRPLIPGNHFTLDPSISTFSFTRGSDNIGNKAVPNLDKLASVLNANGDVRVTLTAYADVGTSTSPRDARRLSLSRALAVRDFLTAKGISSARIDVRALGANVPSGDPDRVDVKVN
ncbi:MAG: OmpA family protein [Alphaproteobacteria bacterium]|nr:OmpA family protein [Alphaproteobacteria bacterium]